MRKTVSVEPLKSFLGTELKSELVFDRFAVTTQKNNKSTPGYVIADTRFKDVFFMGLSRKEEKQYEISINFGREFSLMFLVTTTDPPELREAWYTYKEKAKMDLNVDGTADTLMNLEKRSVYIKVDENWESVKSGYGSKFKKQTVDGRIYRFEHSTGEWVLSEQQQAESE